jgi:hypothetical protein
MTPITQLPPGGLSGRFFPSLIMVDRRCNLVHAWLTSIMIDSPWRLPHLPEYGKFATRSLFFQAPETMT